MGIAGQINLAQVAFFGVGAYATAILTTRRRPRLLDRRRARADRRRRRSACWSALPALRMQSHYLGIVTLGLALAFTNWVTNAAGRRRRRGHLRHPGAADLPGIDLSSEYLFYYLELIVFAVALAFGLFVVHTPLGRRMRAMRDDSLAAGAVGVEVPLLRMTAFLLASVYGGVAGVLYAGLIRYVAPETFSIANMFLLLAMVIIGGRQSLVGCVVGAVGAVADPRAAGRLPHLRAGRATARRGARRWCSRPPAWPGCRGGVRRAARRRVLRRGVRSGAAAAPVPAVRPAPASHDRTAGRRRCCESTRSASASAA